MATGGSLIGALRVTLGLDTAQFEAGTKRARGIAQRDANAIQKSLAGIKNSFDNLRDAAITGALVAAGKRALDYASSLGEVAQQLGVTTKELQEYRYAASQVGVSNEEMDKSLAKLTRTIGEAKAGSKEQATVFRDLGVAIQDANGRVYSAGEVIPKLADALSRIKDPATRARYEVDLFGKAGQKLDTLLAGGSEAVNELRDAAQKLGIVLSDRQIQNADDTADKLAAVKQVLEARIAGVVSDNAQAILNLASALAALANTAVQAANKMPAALAVLGGAAVGGRVAGAPGALMGSLSGLTGALGYYAANDPYKVQGDTKESLISRQRSLVTAIRQLNGAGMSETQDFKDLMGESRAIDAEIGKRMKALKAGKPAPAITPVIPDGSLPTVKPSGGRSKGKSGPKDRTEEKLERFNKELAGLKEAELAAQQDLTTDINERARYEQMRLDAEQKAYEFDVDSRVKQGDLTAAQGEQLKLAKQAVLDAQRRAVDEKRTAQIENDTYMLAEQGLDARAEQLQIDLGDARTSERRRQINLELLDLDIERQRELVKHLQSLRDLNQASDAEVSAAEARLKTMEGQRDARGRQVSRENAGPWQEWLQSLPQGADEINERFERAAVEGVGDLKDALKEAALQGGSLWDKLTAGAERFQAKLLDLAFDKGFEALFGGGGGSGSGGGLLAGFASLFGGGGASKSGLGGLGAALGKASGFAPGETAGMPDSWWATMGGGLPHFAGGGSFRVGGIPGTDNNVLSINGIPRAKVSANENLHVRPANDRGGSGQDYFDLRGAVVTEDLLNQMNAIARRESVSVVGAAGRRQARAARQDLSAAGVTR